MILPGIKKLHPSLKVEIAIIVCFILTASIVTGQANRLDHVLLQNFDPEGKVLELIPPENWQDQNLLIGWQTNAGQQYSEQVLVTRGKNYILPKQGWSEPIRLLATNKQGFQSRVIQKNIGVNFFTFLKPNLLTPGSINFHLGYSFGAVSFDVILIAIFLIVSILVFIFRKKGLLVSLCGGLIFAFFFLSIRQIKDHADVINKYHTNQQQLPPFEGLETFFDNCQATVGNSSWTIEKLPGVWNSYAKYNMAANPYLPKSNSQMPRADYLFTSSNFQNGTTVSQSRNIKLIKINQ